MTNCLCLGLSYFFHVEFEVSYWYFFSGTISISSLGTQNALILLCTTFIPVHPTYYMEPTNIFNGNKPFLAMSCKCVLATVFILQQMESQWYDPGCVPRSHFGSSVDTGGLKGKKFSWRRHFFSFGIQFRMYNDEHIRFLCCSAYFSQVTRSSHICAQNPQCLGKYLLQIFRSCLEKGSKTTNNKILF